jgi:hypothetical protein
MDTSFKHTEYFKKRVNKPIESSLIKERKYYNTHTYNYIFCYIRMYFFLRFKEREDCEGLSAQRAELGKSMYEKVNECWEKLHREKNAEL